MLEDDLEADNAPSPIHPVLIVLHFLLHCGQLQRGRDVSIRVRADEKYK